MSRDAAKGRGSSRQATSEAAIASNETEQIAVRVPVAFARRVRSAVRYTPDLTITELVIRAVTSEIDRLERRRGERFPFDERPARRGRPVRRD